MPDWVNCHVFHVSPINLWVNFKATPTVSSLEGAVHLNLFT